MAETPTDESAATETPEETPVEAPPADDFDKDRAMKTIKAQREAEKELKAELAKYRAAEEAELEKQKSLDEKLADRETRIQHLESRISNLQVESGFKEEAREMGIEDPELAFLAAKEQGFLGAYDPETGKVEPHKFDELVERFPTFAPKEGGQEPTGDAGRRSPVGARTPSDAFNRTVRGAIQRSR